MNRLKYLEQLVTKPIAVLNGGQDAVNASALATQKSGYAQLYRTDFAKNSIDVPEPTNDIANLNWDAATSVAASFTGDTSTSNNPTIITNVSDFTNVALNQRVVGPNIAVSGVVSITAFDPAAKTITMSVAAAATGTGSAITARAVFTATASTSSNVLTGVSSFAGLAVGHILFRTGSTGGLNGAAGQAIQAIDTGAGTITLAGANPTVSGSMQLTAVNPSLITSTAQGFWTNSVLPFIQAMEAQGFGLICIPTIVARNYGKQSQNATSYASDTIRAAYNAFVRGQSFSSAASGRKLCDYDVLTIATSDYASVVHPTASGYYKMAQVQAPIMQAFADAP